MLRTHKACAVIGLCLLLRLAVSPSAAATLDSALPRLLKAHRGRALGDGREFQVSRKRTHADRQPDQAAGNGRSLSASGTAAGGLLPGGLYVAETAPVPIFGLPAYSLSSYDGWDRPINDYGA